MNPEIAAAVREKWHWHLFFAQWTAIGQVAMQERIITNLDTMAALTRDGHRWRLFAAQWKAIGMVAMQSEIIANHRVIIANLEKLATPIDDTLVDLEQRIDALDKVSDAQRAADARYIAALEAALDETSPGWRTRVTRAEVPSA